MKERRRPRFVPGCAVLAAITAWGLGAWIVVGHPGAQSADQRSPAVSPSGGYVLTVPIQDNRWTVTIRDRQSGPVFRDDSDFIGQLAVYWVWDPQDRVWLYNSDTSQVFFWERVKGQWQRVEWGYGHTRKIARSLTPPETLYPPYARTGRSSGGR